MNIPAQLQKVVAAIGAAGGRPLIVGGAVRDHLMGIEPKDFDIEVYGLSLPLIVEVVKHLGSVCQVGKAFGIVKLRVEGLEYDLSVPRRENKIGVGHKDYETILDPNMSPKEAAARRDFTMNAVYFDPQNGEIVDPYDGRYFISCRILHPASDAFKEDALRILRGMQFAARFDMGASIACGNCGQEMKAEYSAIPKERIWGEWAKWAGSQYPMAGIEFLLDCGWLELYPEIGDLRSCLQDPIWHPEGNAFYHTLLVCDEMAAICKREGIVGEQRIVMMFAALCHDFGLLY